MLHTILCLLTQTLHMQETHTTVNGIILTTAMSVKLMKAILWSVLLSTLRVYLARLWVIFKPGVRQPHLVS